jgi:uncharacterized protein YbjT (DUF2867 family)
MLNLVVGATGSLGSMIVRRLLDQGKPVRAFVRESSNYQAIKAAGAEVVFGDLRDAASVARACKGVRRVITTATAPLAVRHIQQECDAIDWHGTQNLIDAAKAVGVAQFVYTSFLGASADASYPLAYAKGKNEVYLKESGLPYTIIQPVLFMEVWIGFVLGAQLQQGTSVTLVGEGNNKLGFVSDKNVCDLIVATLGHQAAMNAMLPLNGPASYSYRQVVAMIEKAAGHPITVKTVPLGSAVPGMPQLVNDLWAACASGGDMMVDTSEIARTFGLKPIKLEEYIEQTFARVLA